MKTSKLLQTLGMVSALAVAGIGCSKQPFSIEGTKMAGINYNEEDGEQILQFEDKEKPYLVYPEKIGVISKVKGFEAGKAYDTNPNARYDVSGYRQFGTTYATNIVPVRATSN